MLPTRWQRGPVRLLLRLGRPAGLVGAVTAPPVAAYTAVLLSDTATPAWHSAYGELPFVVCGSAAAASGGWGMATAPVAEAGPARAFAGGGAAVELLMAHRMESSMGLSAELLHTGKAGTLMRASKVLTAAGAAGALLGGRSRLLSVVSGTALMAGSLCTRLGVYEAGMASARDPKYTVVPQRERVERGERVVRRVLIARAQVRESAGVEAVEPLRGRPDGVERDDAARAGGVERGGQQCDATAPRVRGDVPLRDAERLAQRADIGGVVFDAGRPRARRRRALAATALVVEDHLSRGGERREGGPEEIVAVDQAAVDGQERRGTGDRW
jgi:hypothetical protein